ncbi:secondary thiamine-phosphate synthase enzyme [Malonomonas rubra DSM 5091]|uniref:Secondary thiamine-phosphate synthase enzyme n=1 Tax=Malonomonas rubra DSM 5091 TaxID=1122189 RepID=A0A1M6M553_MALRU|nr:secondary thiamine-phosphate synthase enzyme YjbQ [Malonomonas rubra]SHJ78578.1 secondary thiamine-phosphate synthase enzyme [Malonomonas rubra DSM 5091]
MLKELKISTSAQTELVEITRQIETLVKESGISEGLVQLFVPHTTAAVTINENADPDVAYDMINGLNQLVPLKNQYRHLEGNSAAHIKSSLIGAGEQIIFRGGKLLLGTWQGIYFCEFDGPRSRKLMVKLIDG